MHTNKKHVMSLEEKLTEGQLDAYLESREDYAEDERIPRAWQSIRNKRSPLLDDADRMIEIALDNNDAQAEAAARAYRQALRDVPQDFSDPDDVVWPTKPEGV
tara:strand:- start:298285 stop:298593 length:309 start_codon:yes stop_codon:yes gene_type:complete